MTILVLALLLQSIPPGPPSRPTNVKVGATTEPARTIEFAAGSGVAHSLSCSDGLCTVTTSSTGGGSGTANYSQSFTSQTSVVLNHNAGTTNVIVACYDSNEVEVIPQSVTVTNANSVTVTFGNAQTGRCVVNSSGGGGGGSVFTSDGIIGNGTENNPVRPDPAGPLASQTFYSASLNFGTISPLSCSERNITASGAVPGLTLAYGWPSTLPLNVVGMMYSGSGVIVVRICNFTSIGIAVTDGLTYSARVVGGF